MTVEMIQGVPVWGDPLDNAVAQILNCAVEADAVALMADHHLGYSVPIGGVVAYRDKLNPAGVGYDIACGNKAVRLDIPASEVKSNIHPIMDDVWRTISFGIGRKNKERVDHRLFDDDPAWRLPVAQNLKKLAAEQLGTVGSGNHYVDIFEDEKDRIWIGVHFGSRGLGHRLATHFMKAADREWVGQQEPAPTGKKRSRRRRSALDVVPSLLAFNSNLGQEYLPACSWLAAMPTLDGTGSAIESPNYLAPKSSKRFTTIIISPGKRSTGANHCGSPARGQHRLSRGRRDSSAARWGISRSFWRAWKARKAGWLSFRRSMVPVA